MLISSGMMVGKIREGLVFIRAEPFVCPGKSLQEAAHIRLDSESVFSGSHGCYAV